MLQQLQQNAGSGGSLATTAGEYARFISLGILNVEGKRKATIEEMLRPQIAIHHSGMFGPGAWQESDEYRDIHLAWGLGWGRERYLKALASVSAEEARSAAAGFLDRATSNLFTVLPESAK